MAESVGAGFRSLILFATPMACVTIGGSAGFSVPQRRIHPPLVPFLLRVPALTPIHRPPVVP